LDLLLWADQIEVYPRPVRQIRAVTFAGFDEPVMQEVIVEVDEQRWVMRGGDSAVRKILRAADPDPYRDQYRDEVLRGRVDELQRLLKQREPLEQPAGF